MPHPVVATLAFDGISPFHLSVPCLVFGEDRSRIGLPRFDFRVCALEEGTILTEAGLLLTAPYGLAALQEADIVIVPSWRELEEPPPPALVDALVSAHRRGALVVGLCLGAFPLAWAGLLDGREATTHWAYADYFRRLFPEVSLRADALYVDNGDVITSAGVAAGLDCCLHIVRERHGAQVAARLARQLVLAPHRQGAQAQFVERPVARTSAPDRFTRAVDEVRSTLDRPHGLDAVASAASMSRRTFTRRFQKLFGTSFGDWLAGERVMLARELLETTSKPVEEIATAAGFGTATSLRQHFAARLKTSPTRYRREFSGRTTDR